MWLLVQNIDVVDKQIRAAIAEHVVYCSRSDKYQMPFVPKVLLNVATLGLINFFKMPKFHTAVCKYGVSKMAPNADVWHYRGVYFYDAYNTMQQFDSDYAKGVYSVLPPSYTLPIKKLKIQSFSEYLKRLPSHTKNKCISLDKNMRLTKIYFRRFRAVVFFVVGFVFSLLLSFLIYFSFVKPLNDSAIETSLLSQSKSDDNAGFSLSSLKTDLSNLKTGVISEKEIFILNGDSVKQLKIRSYSLYPDGFIKYQFMYLL